MKIAEIRKRTAYNPKLPPTQKAATRNWLRSKASEYPIALTLTLKQKVVEDTGAGVYMRQITKNDCEKIARKFKQKLNREVFGKRAADKRGMSLKYLVVVEGERSCKNLHLHIALGGLPSNVKLNKIDGLIKEAKCFVDGIDEQHKVDVADSGWFDYITKELGTKDTDNVLWDLA